MDTLLFSSLLASFIQVRIFSQKGCSALITTTLNRVSPSSPPQTETIAVLPGLYSELEAAKNLLNLNVVNRPKTLEEVHAIWDQAAKANAHAQRRTYSLPHIDLLPKEWQSYEQELKNRPKFKCCLPRVPFCLRKVSISSLITPQWYVNLNHVEKLENKAPAPDNFDWEDMLRFAFPTESALDSPQQNGAGLLFSPHLQNAHITLSPVQRGAVQEYISTLRVHSAPNYLQVAKIGNRLVIVNGVHRVCALWRRGWKKIPCLFREAQNLGELGLPPGQLGVLPEQSILIDACPPYVFDLLDDTLTLTFQQYCAINTQIGALRLSVAPPQNIL